MTEEALTTLTTEETLKTEETLTEDRVTEDRAAIETTGRAERRDLPACWVGFIELEA